MWMKAKGQWPACAPLGGRGQVRGGLCLPALSPAACDLEQGSTSLTISSLQNGDLLLCWVAVC